MLILGTAQLGLDYGANNSIGMLSEGESLELLQASSAFGISAYDTAAAYGLSEVRIGNYLSLSKPFKSRVITKLSPLDPELKKYRQIDNWIDELNKSLKASLINLQTNTIDTLLVHRWTNWKAFDYSCRNFLVEQKKKKTIFKIGASVSSIEEFIEASNDSCVDTIQLPCNVMDWRWHAPEIEKILYTCGKEIHVRSVYLQGILLADANVWPANANAYANLVLNSLDKLVDTIGRKSRADLCISYMRSHGWVDGIIIGAETPQQVREAAALFENPPLTVDQVAFVRESLPRIPESILNPALWVKR